MNRRFAPRQRFANLGAPRLIYFIDGVRVRKVDAVRAVMLHLILSHELDWNYAAAERALEQSAFRHPVHAARQNVWADEQRPKLKRRER